MNIKNLHQVFDRYIEKFEWLNRKPEPNESYKWVAVQKFQNAFDLNVPTDKFAAMLLDAWKSTSNLIDSSQQQPFYALVEYAREEPERVRTMFRDLYADDGGDLTLRQAKIEKFLSEANALLQKYFPTSHRYINSQRSAMALLWFYDPNTYYYYKAPEAKYLANCVEFYDDWGTYSDFKLDVFYRFCDEIVAQMENHISLKKTHESRFEKSQEPMHRDENLHILIIDIFFCAKHYGLYDGIPIKDSSAHEKRLYLERKAKAAELYEAVQIAEKNIALLDEARTVFSELVQSGVPIFHKSFGVAELVEYTNGYVTLFFPSKYEQKRFGLLQSLVGGFIKIDTPNYNELLGMYRQAMRIEACAVRLYEDAVKAMEPYKEYLD